MLKNENINKLKEEIQQKYPIIYAIDLKNDIDHAASPQNEIKQTNEYLEFVCEKGEEVSFGDFEVICGQLEEKEEYFQGILQKQTFCEKENIPAFKKNFGVVLPLHDKYDVLNISFNSKAEQCFKMAAYNDYIYQIQKDIKAGTWKSGEDNQIPSPVKSPQAQLVTFNLEPRKNLSVAIVNKGELYQYISFEYNFPDNISFYLDYKSKKININNQKWRETHDVDFDNLKYFEMQGSFKNDTVSFDNDDFYIYKVMYAKNKGYIYLKPVTLQKGKYKLFLYYAGEIILEYAKGNSDDWEVSPEKFRLTEKQELRFRIKMNAGDKLHDLFIVNTGFKR